MYVSLSLDLCYLSALVDLCSSVYQSSTFVPLSACFVGNSHSSDTHKHTHAKREKTALMHRAITHKRDVRIYSFNGSLEVLMTLRFPASDLTLQKVYCAVVCCTKKDFHHFCSIVNFIHAEQFSFGPTPTLFLIILNS